MNGTEILREVRVIVLAGEEFQRLERLSALIEETVDKATRDFNYDSLWPEDFKKNRGPRKSEDLWGDNEDSKRDNGVGRFSSLLQTYPMMAERRVIVFRFFDDLHPEIRKKICALLQRTPETTLVILEGEKISLSPKPSSVSYREETFKQIYDNKLPDWIRKQFAKRGKKITEDAIALMINNVGSVLGELNKEIEKVVVAVEDKNPVTVTDVEKIVGTFRRYTTYALCNAVGAGDFGEAAHVLTNLMETEKNKETWYITLLASHLMKIAEYNAQIKAGTPPGQAMKVLTASEFLWKTNKYGIQVKNFGWQEVRRALIRLADTDSSLKKSSLDHRLIMELMLPFIMPGHKITL
ncbi:MAG: DNA polymerase III subunit delta [Candidatus Latescibacter sp.]|nr:DNA polymerase III subunit delta [Candidatus Latescibacter sp.]